MRPSTLVTRRYGIRALFVHAAALVLVLRASAALGQVTFPGPELLGRPTDSSVTINVVPGSTIQAYFEYGLAPATYPFQTPIFNAVANEPLRVVLSGLQANTRYYYRMQYSVDGMSWTPRAERSFHTQRATGSAFTFTITSDSHINILLGTATLWQQTLTNVAADAPDFHLDLGDTFAMDNVTTQAQADSAYLAQRPYMGLISHSAPIFLVYGNHEQPEGWHLDDTGNIATSRPVLGTNSRKRYFLNPVPNAFYSGNPDASVSGISGDGLLEDYFAWEWGNALFVAIDPYWYTMTKPFTGNLGGGEGSDVGSGDRWDWTLGAAQYEWLADTLSNSMATFKFVFAHHVAGGTEDYGRGGANAVPYCEWGGNNENGTTPAFDVRRPGWEMPIHQLLVENRVTAFFHGHDHEFAYEERDGVVYQLVPMGADTSYGFGFQNYNENDPYTIRVLPNSGHVRVTVAPSAVTVDYVRAYLAGQGTNGVVAYTYAIPAPGPTTTSTSSSTTTSTTSTTVRASSTTSTSSTSTTAPPPTTTVTTTSTTTSSAATSTSLPAGLVAAYGFDEIAGMTVGDASGNGNSGVMQNATRTTAGLYGGAITFGGASSWVTVNDAASLDLTTGLTLEAWVNPTSLTGWRDVVAKETAGGVAYWLYAAAGGGAPATGAFVAGAERELLGTGVVALNTWTHLAGTYDGAMQRLYVNGMQVSSRVQTGGVSVSASPLRIGGNSVWGEVFAGRIDEVRVYNRALSQAEIQGDMNRPIGGASTTTSSTTVSTSSTSSTSTTSSTSSTAPPSSTTMTTSSTSTTSTTPSTTSTSTSTTATTSSTSTTATTSTSSSTAPPPSTTVTTSSTTTSSAVTSTTLPAGLVAAYGFDEPAGMTITDASGNGNGGVMQNATRTTAGRYGGAITFGGASSWVTVNDAASLDLTTGVTVEAWVNPTSVTGWRDVVAKETANGVAYWLYAAAGSGRPTTGAFVAGAERELLGPSGVALNTWTHLAGTYDGAMQRLYVNAVQVATRVQTGGVSVSASPLRIGGNSIWGEVFAGRIDEVRIYNRALSQEEIQADMNRAITP
jgi:cytoskeletal protein RodZ